MRPAEVVKNPSGIVLLSCSRCPEKIDIQKPFHEIFLTTAINTLTEYGNLSPASQMKGYFRLCERCSEQVQVFLNERRTPKE